MSDLNPPAGSDLEITKQTTKNYAMFVFWIMFSISFLNSNWALASMASAILPRPSWWCIRWLPCRWASGRTVRSAKT